MADWQVPESDEEDDTAVQETVKEKRSATLLDAADPGTLLELLQTLKRDRILQLDCTGGETLREDIGHRKRVRRKRKRKRENSHISTGGPQVDGVDITSETTSEIKSTHTASTSECRDPRRPTLSAFDYEHEDFSSKSLSTKSMEKSRRCLLPGLKPKKKINLDEIEATLRKEEDVRWTEEKEELPSPQLEPPRKTSTNPQVDTESIATNGGASEVTIAGKLFWEDSDNESDNNASFSSQDITAQINQIEQLLDKDGLSNL